MKGDVDYCLQHSFEYNQSLNIYRNFLNKFWTVEQNLANGASYEIIPCNDNIFGQCAYKIRCIVHQDVNEIILRLNGQTESDFDITLCQNNEYIDDTVLLGKVRITNNSGQQIRFTLQLSTYTSKERLQQAGIL